MRSVRCGRKTYSSTYYEDPATIEESYSHLACAVVAQAIEDWRRLLSKGSGDYYHTNNTFITRHELETFFKSKWAETLLCNTDITQGELWELVSGL